MRDEGAGVKRRGKPELPTVSVASRARAHARDWREAVDAIAEHMREGMHLEPAARLEGVSIRTIEEAIKRDDPAVAPLLVARAEIERELVRHLMEHSANGRPHGATTYLLERLAPKRWRQADQLEVSGPDGGPVRSETVTEDQLRARLALLAKKLGGGE